MGKACRRWLPVALCGFFCAATLWVLVCELPEAWTENRRARAALTQQIEAHDRLVADRDELMLRCLSLEEDPQERERVLDELFLLPKPADDVAER